MPDIPSELQNKDKVQTVFINNWHSIVNYKLMASARYPCQNEIKTYRVHIGEYSIDQNPQGQINQSLNYTRLTRLKLKRTKRAHRRFTHPLHLINVLQQKSGEYASVFVCVQTFRFISLIVSFSEIRFFL